MKSYIARHILITKLAAMEIIEDGTSNTVLVGEFIPSQTFCATAQPRSQK